MISDRESVALRCRQGTINNNKRKKLLKAYLVDAQNKNKPGHKQIIWGEKSLHKQPDTTLSLSLSLALSQLTSTQAKPGSVLARSLCPSRGQTAQLQEQRQ